MLRLFLTHSLRYFARHPALTALNIVGIALGVTVFLSIEIVNHSALESFRASVDIFADGPLRTFTLHDAQDQAPDVLDFLRDPKVIALSRKLVDRLHLKIGDP